VIVFVTAIDTGVGKTYATGLLARYLLQSTTSVITMKLAQTGCTGISEDILEHRRLMGIDLLPEDRDGATCPYVFPFPASPHLAAREVGVEISPARLRDGIDDLASRYEHVIIEGVGGLCVPLTETVTLLDFMAEARYPTLVVSTPKLGSINHTLLTLEALRTRDVPIAGVLYNRHLEAPQAITDDSRALFRDWLKQHGSADVVIDLPRVAGEAIPDVDFAALRDLHD
jgi:dethiobiotin synthetase